MVPWKKEFSLDLDLIPRRPENGCPNKKPYKNVYDFQTCSCENHCSWDLCRLHDPPGQCLAGTGSTWKWDILKSSWVAQVVQGIKLLVFNILECTFI